MKCKVEIAEIAHADIESVYRYIANDNEAAAAKIVNTIYRTIEKLADNPMMGRRLDSRCDVKSEFRYTIARKMYLVFYLVGDNVVHIARVLDGRRDYLTVLHIN